MYWPYGCQVLTCLDIIRFWWITTVRILLEFRWVSAWTEFNLNDGNLIILPKYYQSQACQVFLLAVNGILNQWILSVACRTWRIDRWLYFARTVLYIFEYNYMHYIISCMKCREIIALSPLMKYLKTLYNIWEIF